MELEDKTAVVTGAGSGIGRATAKRLADEGAAVVVTDLDPAAAEETAGAVASDRAMCHELDVRDQEAVAAVLETVHEEYGGLDVLVNNAGVGDAERFEDVSARQFDAVVETNVRGVWNGCRGAVPLMRGAGGGAIVNVSSLGGLVGMPYHSHYCLSKGAVLSLSRALAVEFGGEDVRVNAVCPGTVKTGRTVRKYTEKLPDLHDEDVDGERMMKFTMLQYPLERFAEPDEVAACIAFLASDDASFVTGHGLVVDGGYSIS